MLARREIGTLRNEIGAGRREIGAGRDGVGLARKSRDSFAASGTGPVPLNRRISEADQRAAQYPGANPASAYQTAEDRAAQYQSARFPVAEAIERPQIEPQRRPQVEPQSAAMEPELDDPVARKRAALKRRGLLNFDGSVSPYVSSLGFSIGDE